jgi:hypothetical protein
VTEKEALDLAADVDELDHIVDLAERAEADGVLTADVAQILYIKADNEHGDEGVARLDKALGAVDD